MKRERGSEDRRRGRTSLAVFARLAAGLVWFWFENRLPARGGGSELEAALYRASRRLRCQVPACTTVKAAVSEALVLMTMSGLDPVACRWQRRWEAVRLGGQLVSIGKLPIASCRLQAAGTTRRNRRSRQPA